MFYLAQLAVTQKNYFFESANEGEYAKTPKNA